MPVIYDLPSVEYHALPAVNASLLWDIIAPEGCLAQAWYNSPFLNPDAEPIRNEDLDNGTIVHLAILEPQLLDGRISIIDAADWRTKEARRLREDAYANGLIPILYDRVVGPSFKKIETIRKALEASPAAPLLFGEGKSEVSFTWTVSVPFAEMPQPQDMRVECKARADRLVEIAGQPPAIVDLKTAPSASPACFQRSMVQYGHHMRAAFYLDGFFLQGESSRREYLFVVVQKDPPHLVSVFRLDARTIEWGRLLYRKALGLYKQARAQDHWPGFMRESIEIIGLPTYAEHQLADREALGEL